MIIGIMWQHTRMFECICLHEVQSWYEEVEKVNVMKYHEICSDTIYIKLFMVVFGYDCYLNDARCWHNYDDVTSRPLCNITAHRVSLRILNEVKTWPLLNEVKTWPLHNRVTAWSLSAKLTTWPLCIEVTTWPWPLLRWQSLRSFHSDAALHPPIVLIKY